MECNEQEKSEKVHISDTFSDACIGPPDRYIVYALCLDGCATFNFNEKEFTFSKGDLLTVNKRELIEDLSTSEDFRTKIIYINPLLAQLATPLTNYVVKSSLSLVINPIMKLNPCQFELCRRDFDNIELRHNATCYKFYDESLRCAVQQMLLDIIDFHARIYEEESISSQYAKLVKQFFDMLDNGSYRTNRSVAYYASRLCVTPKYLSEVCKTASGHSANFWINRYTNL